MKTINVRDLPVNVLVGKERQKNLYEANFDSLQVNPRVTLGSTWVAEDRRYNRRYLMRVVDLGYTQDYDLRMIIGQLRENVATPFDNRSLEYYCSEKAWLRLEGEFTSNGLKEVFDQPTVLQTFLSPTTLLDDLKIASSNATGGFAIGNLRSGDQKLNPIVTLPDRFVGHRTLITGTSGFGKSTLIRNIARYWLENNRYGKIIDDLKGEYVSDIKDESDNLVSGLCHHPNARKNLYLLTSQPERYQNMGLENKIAGIITLCISINDIPVDSLKDIATHLSQPQRTFLEMYQEKTGLFRLLLQQLPDGSPDTTNWHNEFKGWIVFNSDAKKKVEKDENFVPTIGDILPSSYTPIHSVIKQLKRLERRPYISQDNSKSCLKELLRLVKAGATIILDKANLTDSDRIIISTVLADHLYRHNEKYSSGNQSVQKEIAPVVYIVEEAHNLLSTDMVTEGSVFVDFAKTGRSFQIGLVAVTQQPSSIDTKIISQFDNFLTLRLTNDKDVKDLINASSAFLGFEGDIRSMRRGAAIVYFEESVKVQSIQVFEWLSVRARTLLSEEQKRLIDEQGQLLRQMKARGGSDEVRETN